MKLEIELGEEVLKAVELYAQLHSDYKGDTNNAIEDLIVDGLEILLNDLEELIKWETGRAGLEEVDEDALAYMRSIFKGRDVEQLIELSAAIQKALAYRTKKHTPVIGFALATNED